MIIPGRYGVALTFEAPVVKAATDGFAASADWTPAAGDVKISKDAGNVANITTLPSAVGGAGSVLWTWPLSATEMEAGRITIQVVDAALKDQAFAIHTLPSGALRTGKATAGSATTLTIGTGFPIKPGQLLEIHGGTNAGDTRVVQSYNSGTGVVTIVGAWNVTPDNTSCWTLWDAPETAPTVVASGTIGSTGNDTTHLHMTGQPFGDDEPNDHLVIALDVSANEYHGRWISDYVNVTALATLHSALPFTPENAVDKYWVYPIRRDTVNEILGRTSVEPTAVPAHTATVGEKVAYLLARVLNKSTFNKNTGAFVLRNAADAGNIATRTDSNDGITYTKAKDV